MKSGKSAESLMLLGKSYRFFAEIRRTSNLMQRNLQCGEKILCLLGDCLVNLGLWLPSSLSPSGNRKRETIERLNRLGTQGQELLLTTASDPAVLFRPPTPLAVTTLPAMAVSDFFS